VYVKQHNLNLEGEYTTVRVSGLATRNVGVRLQNLSVRTINTTKSRNTKEYICHSPFTKVWRQKEERKKKTNRKENKGRNGMEKLFTQTYDTSVLQNSM
jgi:hypothetical protein